VLDLSRTSLPWIQVSLISQDAFSAGWQHTVQWLAISGAISVLVGMLLSMLTARFFTQPLKVLNSFLKRVSTVGKMKHSVEKRACIKHLQLDWGLMVLHAAEKEYTRSVSPLLEPDISLSPLRQAELESRAKNMHLRSWSGVHAQEVHGLSTTFGELLDSWAGQDELQEIQQSKRQFIRCQWSDRRGMR
jgi:HAMP domain-containing protein